MTENTPNPNPQQHADNAYPDHGSIERALAGDYQLPLAEVIKEAWGRVSGNKGTVWGALLLYMAVTFALSLVLGMLFGTPSAPEEGVSPSASGGQLLQQLLVTLAITPLWVGTIFLGVAIASDRPARPTSIFSWYDKTLKLFLTYLLMGLMIVLGTLLLVLPGIYLAVSYQLALPLVADKNLGPWQALETSRKAVTPKWFTFLGLGLVAALAIMASMILIGIPLIWVAPAFVIAYGIVYRNTFGAEPASLDRVAGS